MLSLNCKWTLLAIRIPLGHSSCYVATEARWLQRFCWSGQGTPSSFTSEPWDHQPISTPVQGERTREGNDLYHEMMASGVIKHPGWRLLFWWHGNDWLRGLVYLVAGWTLRKDKAPGSKVPISDKRRVLFKHVFVTRKSLIDVFWILWIGSKKPSLYSKAALVYGQMNEPPGARARVALTGLTVAEYFRGEEGQEISRKTSVQKLESETEKTKRKPRRNGDSLLNI